MPEFERKWTTTEANLTSPLRWRKPSMVRVGTDLFHESALDEWLDRIFAVMALCPQHVFQVLTKRPARMREYIAGENPLFRLHQYAAGEIPGKTAATFHPYGNIYSLYLDAAWPLPNVWLGVSAEDQATADERIPMLLDTPAAVRFVSLEPLLGPIDLTSLDYYVTLKRLRPQFERTEDDPNVLYDVLRGHMKGPDDIGLPHLDWVIVGGESGPNARPMHPDWVRSLRDQCQAAGVPFFFKQWGGWGLQPSPPRTPIGRHEVRDVDGVRLHRFGKKAAGRLLDGVEHNAYPEVA